MPLSVLRTITHATLTLSAIEVLLLIGLLTLALLFRLPRFGLIVAYAFVYRWCWSTMRALPPAAQLFYVAFGVLAVALAAYEMLADDG